MLASCNRLNDSDLTLDRIWSDRKTLMKFDSIHMKFDRTLDNIHMKFVSSLQGSTSKSNKKNPQSLNTFYLYMDQTVNQQVPKLAKS